MSVRRTLAGLVLALTFVVGVASGWWTGVAAGNTARARHAATTSTSTTTTTAATTTTATQPVVTVVNPPPVGTRRLPGTGRPPIELGDLASPQQFIIGQLYQLALQHEGYTIYLTRNVGVPAIRTAAVLHGTLDIYPESLGEWNSAIAHLHRRFATVRAAYRAASAYARSHGFVLLPPTPFSSTSCLAVLAQYAQAGHVHSLPQLARVGGVILGVPAEFAYINDGLPALERAYHLRPGYVQSIGIGLQYWWLDSGNVQAAYCNTTDPQLSGPDYVALSDPKHIFGHGNIVPVTTPRVLRREGPVFARTIERVDRLLTLRAMRGLNAEYSLSHDSSTAIAYQFLEGNGILPPSRFAPVSAGGS
jgi:glycine betaine/choline ABC-type transport system substrate-binding protein